MKRAAESACFADVSKYARGHSAAAMTDDLSVELECTEFFPCLRDIAVGRSDENDAAAFHKVWQVWKALRIGKGSGAVSSFFLGVVLSGDVDAGLGQVFSDGAGNAAGSDK